MDCSLCLKTLRDILTKNHIAIKNTIKDKSPPIIKNIRIKS